jgi:hypothetical protein
MGEMIIFCSISNQNTLAVIFWMHQYCEVKKARAIALALDVTQGAGDAPECR